MDRNDTLVFRNRDELFPITMSDWRRMARQGKWVLPNSDDMDFVPVKLEVPEPVARPLSATSSGTIEVVEGDVAVLLDAVIPATRIAEIARSMAS